MLYRHNPILSRYFHHISKTERRIFMMSKFGPPINRSMTQLDRDFFRKDVTLLAAYFPQPQFLARFVKECKKDILMLPSIKHIVPMEKSKAVLLRDDIDDISQISEDTRAKMDEMNVQLKPYTMSLDYNFWKADDILRAVLPEDLLDEIPTGFAQAGHVAHLNLRNEFKPYGLLIGQVILDKNSKVETVVDKLDTIDTKFRTFKMQVLAGKDDLNVEQSESGCRFQFDFSKVYWNSRLNTEHERLIDLFKPHEAVADVFAGVGPFAVPAGKKNVVVLANDLNPESFKYLKNNITLNKTDDFVKPYKLDGREFIRKSPYLLLEWANSVQSIEKKRVMKRRKIDPETKKEITSKGTEVTTVKIPKFITNYVMNLPDSALTFLDEFIGLYSDPAVRKVVENEPNFEPPTVNVHCFEKFSPHEPEPTLEELHHRIHKRITDLLKCELPFEKCSFHLVRRVAPTKPMFCVTFQLPHEVVFRN